MKFYTFSPEILRAYDIRGTMGKTLHTLDAHALGLSMGTWLQEQGSGTFGVGYDGRTSSPQLAEALIDGLVACGIHVYNFGMLPTPQLYFGVVSKNLDGGIMVTGSHNPPEDNGFKITLRERPFFGDDIQALGVMARRGAWATQGGGCEVACDIQADYITAVLSRVSITHGLRIAWDIGNGAAGVVLPALCKQLPGQHILLNEKVDGTFPAHPPDPTKEANLAQLRACVLENACDMGLAFDGDADRVVAVDGKGRIIFGDKLLLFFAQAVLKERPNAVIIGDVKCSDHLFSAVKQWGGTPVMCKTGHSFIKEKIIETGAQLAGEASGHFFFKDRYFGYDDGIYAALRLIELVAASQASLSDALDACPASFITPELKLHCNESEKFLLIESLRRKLAANGLPFNGMDGVRVAQADGWWLARASNTEPVIVVRAEGNTKSALQGICAHIYGLMEKTSHDVGVIDLSPLIDFKPLKEAG